MGKESMSYSIRPTTRQDIPRVVDLIASEPNILVPVTAEALGQRVDAGLSFVAQNEVGEVIGHQGATVWAKSGIPELGSAIVAPEYRGHGINTEMKRVLIPAIQEKIPDQPVMSFTEKGSMSRGILKKLGFEEQPMSEVSPECFTICPAGEAGCYGKTGIEPPPCGCVVFVLKSQNKVENG